MGFPALDQVFQVLNATGETGIAMKIGISELDIDKPGDTIDLKRVFLFRADEKNVAAFIIQYVLINLVRTCTMPDINQFIMIVLMQRVLPFWNLKFFDQEWFELPVSSHSRKVQIIIGILQIQHQADRAILYRFRKTNIGSVIESNMQKTALVVGANGVIGSNLIDHLSELGDWDIIGLSRRGGIDQGRLKYLSLDLLDEEESRSRLSGLTAVTHIFYVAYQDRPTWAELVAPNLAMLVNVVNAVEPVASNLEHISLMQGYKVYGAHLGPFKTPAKESDGKHMPPEFNVDQQDFLENRQQGKSWTWSAIRPSVVGGTALGNPMNLVLAIAVYASISKELGIPLRFPGKPGAYDKLMEMTDAGLLAKATVWAATNVQGANQAFNITNGDLFRWNELWPRIAAYFKLETAPPLQLSLGTVMTDKAKLWKSIQKKYSLVEHAYQDLSAWGFADAVFGWDYDFFADSSKARRAGFHEFTDTEKMFYDLFDDLRTHKVIP